MAKASTTLVNAAKEMAQAESIIEELVERYIANFSKPEYRFVTCITPPSGELDVWPRAIRYVENMRKREP